MMIIKEYLLTGVSAELLLGEDDLAGGGVVGVGDGVVEDADGSDDLAVLPDLVGDAAALDVAGVADDQGRLGLLGAGSDAGDAALGVEEDLIHLGVEHVGAAVDGAQSGEGLGETAQAVDGVEEGGVAVLAQGLHVELDLLDAVDGGLLEVLVVAVEGDGVAEEVDGVVLELVLLEDVLHGLAVDVDLLPGLVVVDLHVLHVEVEVPAPLLLEEPHEGTLEGLGVVGGDLVDDGLGGGEEAALLLLVDVGAVDALPLEVARDLGVEEHLDQVAVGHDELGDQVHVPVPVVPVLLGGLGAGAEHAPQVGQVEGGRLTAVVAVAVEVEDLLALDGEQAGEDALLKAGAEHYHVVFLVHFSSRYLKAN